MHRINSYIHYFFVPNRIIWGEWERFVTKGDISLPTEEFTGSIYPGSIGDLLGLPTRNSLEPSSPVIINNLPFRAMFQIWKDYYIDQNLTTMSLFGDPNTKAIEAKYEDYGGEILYAFTGINRLYRCWEKDYFTSALPWAQKGEPVSLNADVKYLSNNYLKGGSNGKPEDGDPTLDNNTGTIRDSLGNLVTVENIDTATITVEEIRTATKLQRFLERNARAGTRYVEHLLAHWGVKSSDARLQRAEYIGGGKSPVVISEVLNHTGTAELPQEIWPVMASI